MVFLITVVLVGLTSLAYYYYNDNYSSSEVVQVDKIEGTVTTVGATGRQLTLNTGETSYKVYFYDDSYVVPVYDYVNKASVSGGFLGQSSVNIMSHIQPGSKLMLNGFIDGASFLVKQAYLTN